MEFTKHFNQMLEERNIHREWIDQALQSPDNPEYENRWLRVVINVKVSPNRAITAFFDRRLRKSKI